MLRAAIGVAATQQAVEHRHGIPKDFWTSAHRPSDSVRSNHTLFQHDCACLLVDLCIQHFFFIKVSAPFADMQMQTGQ